jgi:hypothetical protein
VFGLGAFSGAATACCAPVLAGAVVLSAASGTMLGGFLLGGAYILGLVAPLLPIAFVVGRLRRRMRDPKLTVRLGGYAKRTTVSRLAGSVIFAGFGLLFVVLALTGNAETAPGFQRTLAGWFGRIAVRFGDVPNAVAWPALAVSGLVFAYLVLKPRQQEESHEQEALE